MLSIKSEDFSNALFTGNCYILFESILCILIFDLTTKFQFEKNEHFNPCFFSSSMKTPKTPQVLERFNLSMDTTLWLIDGSSPSNLNQRHSLNLTTTMMMTSWTHFWRIVNNPQLHGVDEKRFKRVDSGGHKFGAQYVSNIHKHHKGT